MINRQRLLELTKKLISIDSQNPPGNEAAIARFTGEYFSLLGASVRYFEPVRGRVSVIAEIKGRDKRKLLLTPHLDTVPAGRNWKHAPLKPVIEKGRLYGLGATDCKCNLACGMEALTSLHESGVALPFTIVFAATADEESGSVLGLEPLLKRGMLDVDAAVVLDADGFDIVVAQKGLFHVKVTVKGTRAHGAYPWRGTNAIDCAMEALARLKKRREHHARNKYLRPATMNIGTIRGGDKVNIVADWCEFELDYRFLPGTTEKGFLADLKKALAGSCAKGYEIELNGVQQPYSISEKDPLVVGLAAAMRRCARPVRLRGSEGATVISFFQQRGIPSVATGFGTAGCEHLADEYVEVKNLFSGARVVEEFLKGFSFANTKR